MTIELPAPVARDLERLAQIQGLSAESLVTDLIRQAMARHDQEFQAAINATLADNDELYQRLAK